METDSLTGRKLSSGALNKATKGGLLYYDFYDDKETVKKTDMTFLINLANEAAVAAPKFPIYPDIKVMS